MPAERAFLPSHERTFAAGWIQAISGDRVATTARAGPPRPAPRSFPMKTRTLAITTTLLLSLGCSAGGSSGEGTTVTEQPAVPGTVLPGDTSPTVTPTTPAVGAGGQLFDPEDVEPTDE